MKDTPLISIITPVYNGEKWIRNCLVSIEQQKFRNYEHIIIDGISNDETNSIIEEFQKNNSSIRLISEKDEGIYDAMNKGIDLAVGEWLYFLGSDDRLYTNETLEKVAACLKKTTSDICYGNVWAEKDNKLYDGEFNTEKILRKNISHQGIFYRKSVFSIAGNYEKKYKIEADYVFNLRCWVLKQIAFTYIHETIAFYSNHGISSKQNDISLRNDYPILVLSFILESKRTHSEKRELVSVASRKIILRYGIIYLLRLIKKAKSGQKYLMIEGLVKMVMDIPLLPFNKKLS